MCVTMAFQRIVTLIIATSLIKDGSQGQACFLQSIILAAYRPDSYVRKQFFFYRFEMSFVLESIRMYGRYSGIF